MPVVRKGAGRPAAAAKRQKHAQRTPLPEKNAEPKPEPKTRKAKQWVAPRADVKTKAEDLGEYARKNGWWASDADVNGDIVSVTCKRINDKDEKEVIYVEWSAGRIRPGSVQYELPDLDRRMTLRNVSAARQVLDGSLVPKREVKARVARKAGPREVLRANAEGKIEHVMVEGSGRMEIIGAHIIDKCYHLKAGTPGKGKVKGKLHARVTHIGAQQRDGLTRFFEKDGYTVIVEECKIHGQPKEKKDA